MSRISKQFAAWATSFKASTPSHLSLRQDESRAFVADGSGNSRGVPERYESGGHEAAGAGDRESDPKKQVRWGTRPFKKARLKLTIVYTLGILLIFVIGFILNSWLDKILAEPHVDPLLYFAEALSVLLIAIISFYLSGRTLKPIEDSYIAQKKFVADAAHELRTPLAVMKTGAEVALAGQSSKDDYQKLIKESLEEIDYMSMTVNDLLFLAQNVDHKKPVFSKVNLQTLVHKQVELMKPYANKKGIMLTQDSKEGAYVHGNVAYLKRLLANLLQNAIDYNNPAGKVTVKLKNIDQQIKLTVSDTGIGISGKDLAHIFDRFYKADQARTYRSGGAGLGLAIVQEIVKIHDAHTDIKSQLGKGTSLAVIFAAYS